MIQWLSDFSCSRYSRGRIAREGCQNFSYKPGTLSLGREEKEPVEEEVDEEEERRKEEEKRR